MRSDKFYGGSWEWGCSASFSFFLSFFFFSCSAKTRPWAAAASRCSERYSFPPLVIQKSLNKIGERIFFLGASECRFSRSELPGCPI